MTIFDKWNTVILKPWCYIGNVLQYVFMDDGYTKREEKIGVNNLDIDCKIFPEWWWDNKFDVLEKRAQGEFPWQSTVQCKEQRRSMHDFCWEPAEDKWREQSRVVKDRKADCEVIY